MKINIAKLVEILNVQKEKSIDEKGFQPGATLSCFKNLGRDDTKICEKCRNYKAACESYLKAVELKPVLFGRRAKDEI
jgi:7-cyano-7-deazaguanine synthase in queuosine biosynthesis